MKAQRVLPHTQVKRLSIKEKMDRMMGSLIKNLNANVLKERDEKSSPPEDINKNIDNNGKRRPE